MKSDFKFSNLLGTVYRQGNLVFNEEGTTLVSPVGNRVTVFDLVNNRSYTLDYEHRKNIACVALNKQGTLLLSVDEDGRAILVNFRARTVLHHFNFKEKVRDLQFSADGKHFALAAGRFVQVWRTPSVAEDRQFAPFVRHRVYAGHYSDVTSVSWSGDSRFLLSTSKDLTARVWSLSSADSGVKMTLAGHRDYVIKAFFDAQQESIYTVSKDGALFRWEYTERAGEEELADSEKTLSWRITAKNFFFSDHKVKCATFHAASNLFVVGFTNGEFRLYNLPDFSLLQQLSMGFNAVNTVTVNASGEWLAFGSRKLGQLLVYEWQSESYILKQQGHFDAMNCLTYSPDGGRIVTASDDGRIKIWDVASGFCLATFEEHTAAVTAVCFAKRGQVLFSASLDGTVRAWDLIRYRNFRTFAAPQRLQFSCLAVDPSGEVVCAGSRDDFQIQVWAVQTAQLLDQLAGHEGPVSCLSFGGEGSPLLASASWDRTVRVWDIFSRTQTSEPFNVVSECLCLAMRPDAREVAAATLDGQITFWDVENAKQVRHLDAKCDVLRGRYLEDRFTAQNSARGQHFSTIAYSFDGLSLVAAGTNNSICLYDLPNEVLLRRFTVSQNMQLNGTLQLLNSKNMTDAGAIDLIDADGELSDLEDRRRIDSSLPGSSRGDISARSTRPEARVTSVQFSPAANAFACASTEGLLVYSVDDALVFDPFDLDIDVTPAATLEVLRENDYLTALVMAFRLNERYLVHKVYESIGVADVPIVSRDLPVVYVEKLLAFVASILMESPHVEFNLLWVSSLLTSHGKFIVRNRHLFASSLRLVQRFLNRVAKDVVRASFKNEHLYEFLRTAVVVRSVADQAEGAEGAESEDEDEDEDEDVIIEDASADSEDEHEGWFGPGEEKAPALNFAADSYESDEE